jgi:hypothetical protein
MKRKLNLVLMYKNSNSSDTIWNLFINTKVYDSTKEYITIKNYENMLPYWGIYEILPV